LDVRKLVPVRPDDMVQMAVFTARVPGTVRFGNHMKRKGSGAVRTANNSCCFHLLELCLS